MKPYDVTRQHLRRPRLAFATLWILTLFAVAPAPVATAAGGATRLAPRVAAAIAQDPPDVDECPIEDPYRMSSKPLDAERRAALEGLYGRLVAGEPFSLEEAAILQRFHDGLPVNDLAADVVIARALWAKYRAHTELSPAARALLAAYERFLSSRDLEVADKKEVSPVARATREAEPNDSLGQANRAPSGFFLATLDEATDMDVFALQAGACGQVTLRYDAGPGGPAAARVELLDERGATLAEAAGGSRVLSAPAGAGSVVYARVSAIEPSDAARTSGTYTLSLSSPCVTDSLDAEDPRFRRMHPFDQGGPCRTGPMRRFEAYEFEADEGPVVASLCASGGGASDYDSFLIIYQAPGGGQMSPFMPGACRDALAANNDFCGEQAEVSATVEKGYFYVVVTGRCGESLGTFTLNATQNGASLPCTKVTSGGGPSEEPFTATMTCAPEPAVTGETMTYTVVISNGAHKPKQQVVVADTLPPQVAFVSCATTQGTYTADGNDVRVDIGTIDGGSVVTVRLVASISCALADGAGISNTATVSWAGGGHEGEGDGEAHEIVMTETVAASNPPPVLSDMANITMTANALDGCSAGAAVAYSEPVMTDNCPGATLVCDPPSGGFFPQGVTTVKCTATDAAGATSELAFKITVGSPFGACALGDLNGDTFHQVVDSASPLYGYWQYRVAATGKVFCGYADYVAYIPGRSLYSYDRNDPVCAMTVTMSYATRVAVVRVTDRATGVQYVLRDRNMANDPPC